MMHVAIFHHIIIEIQQIMQSNTNFDVMPNPLTANSWLVVVAGVQSSTHFGCYYDVVLLIILLKLIN